jgi:hypothetical protein
LHRDGQPDRELQQQQHIGRDGRAGPVEVAADFRLGCSARRKHTHEYRRGNDLGQF